MSIAVIVLAAGQGSRMNSTKPKVLHKLAGKSLLSHVLLAANELDKKLCSVVYGYKGSQVKSSIESELKDQYIYWAEQKKQLGTGHAVSVAVSEIDSELKSKKIEQILILYGDVPLVNPKDLNKLIKATGKNDLGLLTLKPVNPYGLGRIIRDSNNNIIDIVEEKDANSQQKLVSEVNTGIFLLPYPKIKTWLDNLKTDNNQQEYYLTDIVKNAVSENINIKSVTASDQDSYLGINTLYQLSQAERQYQFLNAIKLLDSGVNIIDPKRIDIRGNLKSNSDVTIDINCIFEGKVEIGSNCIIEANCILKNMKLGNGVHVKANSCLEDSVIDDHCVIGPFARIRPNTVLDKNVNIGNFVEIKKTQVSKGSKINHLSYIGDATIGSNVNIGAGTITCNYDGVNKHKTVIGDNAFIGSNSSLVAPVIIGENSTIGAGSTISKNAPENKLTLSRAKQSTVETWKRANQNNIDTETN